MNFVFDAGFSYPRYLAHLTIGVGRHTLWFTINTYNWKTVHARKEQNRWVPASACLSVFTVSYTK